MDQALADTVVAARGVWRSFPSGGAEVHAVRDVSMEAYPGELVALLGRSGSGKTTLLNLLGGLDTPTQGAVYILGQDLASLAPGEVTDLRRHKLGFVFQSFGLLPLLSAQENVELPLRIASAPAKDRERRAREALETVGLAHRMKHRPYELSGGEQQRVAIARALVNKPPLILADEPTAELDSATAKTIFALLLQIVDQERTAVVVATHDRNVLEAAHRVLRLEDGALVAD
ncbi:MAG: ABC transporter ATP-binding protein [Chloroflexi bacterium]|nr:ABC transporter ATP-binding protein [Chloroflexota bacterium]